MTSAPGLVDGTELDPVRDALLDQAHRDARATLAQADREAAGVTAAAEAEVAQLLGSARAQAAEDTELLEAAGRSRALHEARSLHLRARREAYDALVAAAATAVRAELADDPDVVAALTRRAHAELGPGAVVTRTPDGGLAAEADGRRLLLPLLALVERAVGDLLAARESA